MRTPASLLLASIVGLGCAQPEWTTPPPKEAADQSETAGSQARNDAQPEAAGRGWRVRDGVFESVHESLRVQTLPGWQLILPTDPHLWPSNFGFGLVHEQHSIEIYFARPLLVGADLAEIEREQSRDWDKDTDIESSLVAQISGVELTFKGSADTLEYLKAFVVIHDQPLQIRIRYPTDVDRLLIHEHIRGALAMTEALTPSERVQLRAELERPVKVDDEFGPGWSLAGGVYRDFVAGVRVTVPSNNMRVRVGAAAEVYASDLQFGFTDPSRDLRGYLLIYSLDDEASAEQWHEAALGVWDEIGATNRGEVGRRRQAGAELLVQTLTNPLTHLHLHIETAIHNGHGIAFSTLMSTRGEDPDQRLAQALAAFELLDTLERAQTLGGRYHDMQIGFAIDPSLDIRPQIVEGEQMSHYQHSTEWTVGDERVRVTAYSFNAGTADRIDVSLRVWKDLTAKRAGRRSSDWFEGTQPYPHQHLTWSADKLRCDKVMLVRGWIIYEIETCSYNEELFERTLASFELLD